MKSRRVIPVLGALLWGALLPAGPGAAAAPDAATADRAAGDAAWERRADGRQGRLASPEPVGAAIAAWERALTADPDDHATRVKLLRAIYFLGEYSTPERRDKVDVFERGREVAETGIDRLAAGFAGDARPSSTDTDAHRALARHLRERWGGGAEAVGIYLWAANHWALWGRYRGPLPAARQGAAGRIRDYAAVVIALDPVYDRAGGHRVLGRLHHEAPRVPLVTGWIDRRQGLAELDRAVELAPEDLLNQLYWIESVLEHDRERRGEALVALRRLAAAEADPEYLIEEVNVLVDARELLAEVDG